MEGGGAVLQLLDQSLEAFLRAEVPLPPGQVEVSFAAPDQDWSAGLNKPTVNAFLWDIHMNLGERQAGMELVEEADGKRHRRPPKMRVDCRYVLTAWTSIVQDEHQLLGSVLLTLLRHPRFPLKYLEEPFRSATPQASITVAERDIRDSDFWSALGGKLKPGLDVVITATLDVALGVEAGAPVERYGVGVGDRASAPPTTMRWSVGGTVEELAAGGSVRTPGGFSKVDEQGRFVVRAETGDEVILEGDEPRKTQVPARGQIRVEKGNPAPS
jgi:hypothetical protein